MYRGAQVLFAHPLYVNDSILNKRNINLPFVFISNSRFYQLQKFVSLNVLGLELL